jgi:hypothetical protein
MAITDFPFRIGPINNITPFTYRDGVTYLEILYLLRDYINDTLRPEFDGEMERIIEEFNAGIENAENTIIAYKGEIDGAIAAFQASVNAEITAHETAVDVRMDAAEADINTAKTGWQTLFNQFMADVEAELAALSDSAFAGLLSDTASATYTAFTGKIRDIAAPNSAMSTKFKGGNIAPKAGGNAWRGLFAEWDWANWIKPQVDRAAALGLNAIRLIGGPYAVFASPAPFTQITQDQYDSRWEQLAAYCNSKNLFLYPVLISKWDLLDLRGAEPDWLEAPMLNSIKSTAQRLSKYKNVIGFDVFQEGSAATGVAWKPNTAYGVNSRVNNNGRGYVAIIGGTSASSGGPTGTGTGIADNTVVWNFTEKALLPSDVIAFMNELRTVTNKPLTMSRSTGDGFGWYDTTSMWYQVFTAVDGADFVDIHIYESGSVPVLPQSPDFQLYKTQKPFLIGEFGVGQDPAISDATRTLRYQNVAALHNRPGIKGSFLWALADQNTANTDNWGVWDNTGFAQVIPAASTSPLSVTAGKRTAMTNVLPTFIVSDKIIEPYRQRNVLNPVQARPRNSNVSTLVGWQTSANTALASDTRGLGFTAIADGNSLISTRLDSAPAVVPDSWYRVDVELLTDVTARSAKLFIDWYSSADAWISSSPVVSGTDSVNQVLTLSGMFKAVANATKGVICVRYDAILAGEKHILLSARQVDA